MLDQYISGIVDRISPEAPVPILDYKKKKIYLEVQVTLQIILLIWVLMLN